MPEYHGIAQLDGVLLAGQLVQGEYLLLIIPADMAAIEQSVERLLAAHLATHLVAAQVGDQARIDADLQAALLGEGDQGIGQGLGVDGETVLKLQQSAGRFRALLGTQARHGQGRAQAQ
ncbi:hypothetical protein SAMN05216588_10668 [Pseudomonas flavescens]|uniref:Uncharacterized protein n=1 Tax=Phytopseudomonas flavescens TaxID=29435 RepID=A0A1G8E463_9GAMM|nr:hypothetical protein SAMN05216588_10668 [Pseudomonas flavescens]